MSSVFQTSFEDQSSGDSVEISLNEAYGDAEKRRVSRPGKDNAPQTTASGSLARLGGAGSSNLDTSQKSLFQLSLIEARCKTQAASAINKDRRLVDHLPENHPDVL